MDHGPICATICKRREKKFPVKKVFLPVPSPRLPKKQSPRFFWLEAGMELGSTVGASFTVGLAKSGGRGGAGVKVGRVRGWDEKFE